MIAGVVFGLRRLGRVEAVVFERDRELVGVGRAGGRNAFHERVRRHVAEIVPARDRAADPLAQPCRQTFRGRRDRRRPQHRERRADDGIERQRFVITCLRLHQIRRKVGRPERQGIVPDFSSAGAAQRVAALRVCVFPQRVVGLNEVPRLSERERTAQYRPEQHARVRTETVGELRGPHAGQGRVLRPEQQVEDPRIERDRGDRGARRRRRPAEQHVDGLLADQAARFARRDGRLRRVVAVDEVVLDAAGLVRVLEREQRAGLVTGTEVREDAAERFQEADPDRRCRAGCKRVPRDRGGGSGGGPGGEEAASIHRSSFLAVSEKAARGRRPYAYSQSASP